MRRSRQTSRSRCPSSSEARRRSIISWRLPSRRLRADVASDLAAAADLLPAIRQMRVRLGLLPGDASETTYAQWQAAKAKADDADARSRAIAEAKADADALRSTIADTVRQNRDLGRRIEDLERQLRERPTAPPPVEAGTGR